MLEHGAYVETTGVRANRFNSEDVDAVSESIQLLINKIASGRDMTSASMAIDAMTEHVRYSTVLERLGAHDYEVLELRNGLTHVGQLPAALAMPVGDPRDAHMSHDEHNKPNKGDTDKLDAEFGPFVSAPFDNLKAAANDGDDSELTLPRYSQEKETEIAPPAATSIKARSRRTVHKLVVLHVMRKCDCSRADVYTQLMRAASGLA